MLLFTVVFGAFLIWLTFFWAFWSRCWPSNTHADAAQANWMLCLVLIHEAWEAFQTFFPQSVSFDPEMCIAAMRLSIERHLKRKSPGRSYWAFLRRKLGIDYWHACPHSVVSFDFGQELWTRSFFVFIKSVWSLPRRTDELTASINRAAGLAPFSLPHLDDLLPHFFTWTVLLVCRTSVTEEVLLARKLLLKRNAAYWCIADSF